MKSKGFQDNPLRHGLSARGIPHQRSFPLVHEGDKRTNAVFLNGADVRAIEQGEYVGKPDGSIGIVTTKNEVLGHTQNKKLLDKIFDDIEVAMTHYSSIISSKKVPKASREEARKRWEELKADRERLEKMFPDHKPVFGMKTFASTFPMDKSVDGVKRVAMMFNEDNGGWDVSIITTDDKRFDNDGKENNVKKFVVKNPGDVDGFTHGVVHYRYHGPKGARCKMTMGRSIDRELFCGEL